MNVEWNWDGNGNLYDVEGVLNANVASYRRLQGC